MNCPSCNKRLDFGVAELNCDIYGNINIYKAPCCGVLLRVWQRRQMTAEIYIGDRTEDDWGQSGKVKVK